MSYRHRQTSHPAHPGNPHHFPYKRAALATAGSMIGEDAYAIRDFRGTFASEGIR